MYHFDVDSAFLHGNLEHEVYVTKPAGIDLAEGLVLKLKKALYGLKQAGKAWNQRIKYIFSSLGLKQSKIYPCVFIFIGKNGQIIIICFFVDDIFVFTNSLPLLDQFKINLQSNFPIKDLGLATLALGINITRDKQAGKIYLDCTKNKKKVLQKSGKSLVKVWKKVWYKFCT